MTTIKAITNFLRADNKAVKQTIIDREQALKFEAGQPYYTETDLINIFEGTDFDLFAGNPANN